MKWTIKKDYRGDGAPCYRASISRKPPELPEEKPRPLGTIFCSTIPLRLDAIREISAASDFVHTKKG
jgi:hypothetical protein